MAFMKWSLCLSQVASVGRQGTGFVMHLARPVSPGVVNGEAVQLRAAPCAPCVPRRRLTDLESAGRLRASDGLRVEGKLTDSPGS